MRLFIALPVTGSAQKALTGTQMSLKKLGVSGRFVPPEDLHVTLCFLGETKDPAPVTEILKRLSVPETALSFDRLTLFGDALAALLRPDEALEAYVRELRAALDNAGIRFDKKTFRAHVTLLRGTALPRPGFDLQSAARTLPNTRLQIKQARLMRSDLTHEGAKYTVIYPVKRT